MFQYLKKLQEKFNFQPKYVLDIGANIGMWNKTFQYYFPQSKIISFEANPNCEEYLKKQLVDYKICLLGDKNKTDIKFYYMKNDKVTTGASIYKENTSYYNDDKYDTINLNMYRLDNIIDNETHIDLVKIDVQGAELNVIEGMSNILKNIDYIILEVSLMRYNENSPLFAEVIKFMDEKGFKVFSILEINYINDISFQCDILFLNKDSEYTTTIADINKNRTSWKVDNIYQ